MSLSRRQVIRRGALGAVVSAFATSLNAIFPEFGARPALATTCPDLLLDCPDTPRCGADVGRCNDGKCPKGSVCISGNCVRRGCPEHMTCCLCVERLEIQTRCISLA
jgi:hypothetical protein